MSAPHVIANRREHPRTLILEDGWGFSNRVLKEVDLPGTVRVITDIGAVDQTEWDALILNVPYLEVDSRNVFETKYYRVADHLYIFNVLVPHHHGNYGSLDRVSGLNTAAGDVTLALEWQVPGHEVRVQQGFDRQLHDSLLAAVEKRETQSGLNNPGAVPDGVVLNAFAVGPQDIVLAGTLNAPGRGEVWFVPSEVSSLGPWIKAAFASWRRVDSKKFPGVPDWWASAEWYSVAELDIASRIADEVATFDKAKSRFETAVAQLESELDDAREIATSGSRQLLRGQDDPLQDAVGAALVELGFTVRDMDLEWDPKERREDFRITDPNVPDWMVIGDATGTTGNAKGGKIMTLQGYVMKYLHEEKPDIRPGMWYLLNREIDKDPNTRSTILRPDEIDPFAAQQGLILDTAALYLLLRHAHQQPEDKSAIREFLRTSIGLIGLPDALSWIASRRSAGMQAPRNGQKVS